MTAGTLPLRISSIVILFTASFLGVTIPLWGEKMAWYKTYVPYLHTMSAGVMVGLAMIHLFPEAFEVIDEHFPDYPVGYALVLCGMTLILALEQLVMGIVESRLLNSNAGQKKEHTSSGKTPSSNSHQKDCGDSAKQAYVDHDHKHFHHHVHIELTHIADPEMLIETDCDALNSTKHTEECGFVNCEHSPQRMSQCNDDNLETESNDKVTVESIAEEHELEMSMLDSVLKADTTKDIILAYALEMTTGIHSLIIGVDLGLLGNHEYKTVAALLIALTFHQLIEGIGLGSVIQTSKTHLGWAKVIWFVCIFSTTVSLGVLIGILTSSNNPTPSEELTKGCVTAIAGGTLLYTALVEMLKKYFENSFSKGKPLVKAMLLLSFIFGMGTMALIGVWA